MPFIHPTTAASASAFASATASATASVIGTANGTGTGTGTVERRSLLGESEQRAEGYSHLSFLA